MTDLDLPQATSPPAGLLTAEDSERFPPTPLQRVGRLTLICVIVAVATWTHQTWDRVLRPTERVPLNLTRHYPTSLVRAISDGAGHWNFAGVPWDVSVILTDGKDLVEELQSAENHRVYSDATLQSEEALLTALGSVLGQNSPDDDERLLRFDTAEIRGVVRVATVDGIRRVEVARIATPATGDDWTVFNLTPRSSSAQMTREQEPHIIELPDGRFEPVCQRRDNNGKVLVEVANIDCLGYELVAFWESCGWLITQDSLEATTVLRCNKEEKTIIACASPRQNSDGLQLVVFREPSL